MLGERERMGDELFVACSLSDLIPADYILRRVNRVLDLSWLREEVAELYCADNGRPGIDPEAAVRLMLAGFFHGIVHDRKLMREASMHVGMRWFAGFALHEALPDHSTLTRLRQRWGPERFARIFERTVAQCAAAGLVGGQTVHVDATLIRADVSWESLVREHAGRVLSENAEPEATPTPDDKSDEEGPKPPSPQRKPGRPRTRERLPKKRSTSDPECTMATSSREFRLTPSYKQHTAVDDRAGVVLDAEVTTGARSEGRELLGQISRVTARLGRAPCQVTADAGYAHGRNWAGLERAGIDAVIVPQRVGKAKAIRPERFGFDARHETVKCPRGHKLRRAPDTAQGRVFRSRRAVCAGCDLREGCVTACTGVRQITVGEGYPAMLRARRRHARGEPADREVYGRHRWQVEGRHGEAKTQHGLARAVRRGLDNVRIQAYLTAAVMNLKRLARAVADDGSRLTTKPDGNGHGRRARATEGSVTGLGRAFRAVGRRLGALAAKLARGTTQIMPMSLPAPA